MDRTKAVVLRRIDYSETSQVLHLYGREAGKIHAIAKGAKRRKGSFRSPFDLFTEYEILRIEKRHGELDVLTSAEPLRGFPRLARDYGRFCAASYVLDLVDEMTLEGVRQPEIYDLLVRTLETLQDGGETAPAVFRFEARFLSLLGHFPRLAECGLCRRPVGVRQAFFSCRDGGAVCTRCKPRDPRRVLVPSEVLGALARYGDPKADVKLSRAWLDPLRRILDDYVRHVAEREPKAMRFMRAAVLGRKRPG